MLPILSLALAAVYAPTGRYGFPSGKRDLPVATVPLPVHIYTTQTLIATKESGFNADSPGEPFWASCGALSEGHHAVGLGTSGRHDMHDDVVSNTVVHAYRQYHFYQCIGMNANVLDLDPVVAQPSPPGTGTGPDDPGPGYDHGGSG